MAIPNVTKATDELAKDFFKRKASTAVRMGICVSCKSKVRTSQFDHDELGKLAFASYKEDGLCLSCNSELGATA